jgi:Domain of unknown function (DUF4333)
VTRRSALMVAPVLLLTPAACGTETLSAGAVARGAEDALEKEVGSRPDVHCPRKLEAAVGARTRCTLTVGTDPTTYGVTVTVTAVHGEKATFDVVVDKKPKA